MLIDTTLVTVCSECGRASCWYGEVMCETAREAATVEVRRDELTKRGLESPHYWTDSAMANGGTQ